MTALPEAIFSNDVRQLVEDLVREVNAETTSSILKARILVPDHATRTWLSHELVDHGLSLLRIEILTVTKELEKSPGSQLTRSNLIPFLLSFLQTQGYTPADAHRLSRRLRLPFALQAFLHDNRLLSRHLDHQVIWNQFTASLPPSTELYDSSLPSPSLFLFGFSSLHPQILARLTRLQNFKRLYLLSPCMLFWGDQTNDRETRSLLNREPMSQPSAEQLETFLNDRHRLLANCGQIGREFSKAIEESPIQTKSCYVLPQDLVKEPYIEFLLSELLLSSNETPSSLLEHVKADLLLLITNRASPCNLPNDRSIEVHAAPTPLREIEALRKRLNDIGPLVPAGVLILTTDLRRYAAAIEQVFGGVVPYQIWGETHPEGAITAFRMLKLLLMSRGDRADWIQLVRHPVFQKTLRLDPKEAEALVDWLSTSSVTWGLSEDHRARYLNQRKIPIGSSPHVHFTDEQSHLLQAFLSTASDRPEPPPLSLLPAIGAFFHFLESLEQWWNLPIDSASFASMKEVAHLMTAVVEAICRLGSGFEEQALRSAASQLEQIATETSSPEILMTEAFKLFDRLVQDALNQSSLTLKAPIIVAEFGTFQPFPANCIAIVGADSETLPQVNEDRLLDRLDICASTLPSSNTYLDRSTFLEAILSAKNLFLSYQSYAFDTREPMLPSPIITDLLDHLDRHYRLDNLIPSTVVQQKHPLQRPLFTQEKLKHPPILHLPVDPTQEPIDLSVIDWAIRAPLHLFFREQFGLFPYKRKSERLFAPPWEIQSEITAHLGKEPLTSRASNKVYKTLATLQISKLQRFTLHLLPSVQAAHAINGDLFSPASTITGTWPGLISEGVILLSDQWERELFYRWPECSVRAFCADQHRMNFSSQAVILAEERVIPLQKPPSIHSWADFAKEARATPYPYTYDIVDLLISGTTPEELFQAICEEAEKDRSGGPWATFVRSLTIEQCAIDLPALSTKASDLWSTFFGSIRTP